MATAPELFRAAGRDVPVSNPDKVLFPAAGYTKLDLVRYYLAVSEGALRAAGSRPNVLVRYPNGVGDEFFYQKRAPASRPDWIEVVALRFPSGRSAEEVVPRDAAALVWMANLACLELHPHPVRAEDLDHPDELRVDLDPVPGVPWSQLREVAAVAREALADVGLTGWPKTSGSRGIHINVRIEPRWGFDQVRRAALALARDIERRAPTLATSKWWKEERHGVFVDYNQNAKDRTVAAAYSVRPTADARVSAPLAWDEVADVEPADFTLKTMPERFARLGDRHEGIDASAGSIDALLELSARQEREGEGDAPWPPHYRKQEGEPPRVQPSKARRGTLGKPRTSAPGRPRTASPAKPRAGAPERWEPSPPGKPTTRAPGRPSMSVPGKPRPGSPGKPKIGAPGKPAPSDRKSPTRRVSKHPLLEIGRARKRPDALAGLERWRARHPQAAAHLEPADVLIDSMRGRFTTWTRIRVNLQHVPPELRPEQEPLDPDDDDLPVWKGVRGDDV